MDNIEIILHRILERNKMLLLRPEEISKEMAPQIQPNDVDNFLIFQAAIRKADIGSILLKADMGNQDEKNTAVTNAIDELKKINLPYDEAYKIVKKITSALEWDNSSNHTFQSNTKSYIKLENIPTKMISTKPASKKIIISISAVLTIGICGFFAINSVHSHEEPQSDVQIVEQEKVEKKVSEMTTNLSLGGLDLGLTVDEMHNRVGQENSTKIEGKFQYYYYDGFKVGVEKGKITSLVSDGSQAVTKLGLHEGSTLDDVTHAYGTNYNRMKYENLQLYEYTFESIDGQKGILRFAINITNNIVDYISVRIPEESKQVKATNPSANKKYTISYFGGKSSSLKLSESDLTLHVGDVIHLVPADNSGEAGFLRIMMDGNPNKMGAMNPKGCVAIEAAGQTSNKGSSTEKIITAKAPGEAVFTVVPNYGDWDKAVKMTIHIAK